MTVMMMMMMMMMGILENNGNNGNELFLRQKDWQKVKKHLKKGKARQSSLSQIQACI